MNGPMTLNHVLKGMTKPEHAMYKLLVRLAQNGEACPSNDLLAVTLGYGEKSAAARMLSVMQAKGFISVHRTPEGKRFVEIPHWGIRTAITTRTREAERRVAISEKKSQAKRRPCLGCGDIFDSEHNGHRFCDPCRPSSDPLPDTSLSGVTWRS